MEGFYLSNLKKKIMNHFNKSSIGVQKFFSVLLIAQLIINLSPPIKFFSAH